MSEKVRDFVEVPPVREYVDFSLLETEKASLLEEYVITKEVEKHVKQILDAIRETRRGQKVFFMIGGYGSGKSYFLVFLSVLIDSLRDAGLWKLMHARLKGEDIRSRVASLKEKGLRLLPVRIDLKREAKTEPIRGIVVSHLKKAVNNYLKERELILPYEYEEIAKAIREAKPDDSARLEKSLQKKQLNLSQLQDMLERRSYEGIQAYKEAFKEQFGLPPEIPTPSIDEILDQALKEMKDDFDGIVFLVDELQKYLEGEPSQKATDDLSTLEALCEAASGRPTIVVMSVLERELAHRFEWGLTYDKLLSRFDSLTLTLEGLDRIILSKLKLKKEIEKALRRTQASLALTRDNFEQLCNIYPINPVTFRLLKLVSDLRARERSAFTFLKWAYPRIMNEPFVVEEKRPSLITPDFLYDYFEVDLENIAKEVVDEVNNLLQAIDNEEMPYLKCMAVTAVMEHQFAVGDLTQAFVNDKSVVTKKLTTIMGKRPEIFPPIKLEEIYAIRPTVGRIVNIVNERMKEIRDPVRTLVTHLDDFNRPLSSCKIKGVERGIEIKFSLLDDADKESKKPLASGTEIRLLVVVPTRKLSRQDAPVGKLIEAAGDANVILALIREQKVGTDILAKYFAAISAKDAGEVTEKDVEAIILNTRPRLEQLFETGNITVFYKRGHITKQSNLISFEDDHLRVNDDFLNEVLAKVFERSYPDFSKLRAKLPKDIDLTTRKCTNDIIGEFFIGESTESIKKPATVKYVQNIAEPLGFAKKEGGKFVFTLPTQGIEGKILRIVREKIREKPETSYVCESLRQLGFPDCLIDMYLSALILQKEFLIKDMDFEPTDPYGFLQTIRTVVSDSKKGKGHNLLAVETIPKEKWLLVRGFLKSIVTGPIEILEAKTITGDQVPKVLKSLKENIGVYEGKLSDLNKYVKDYETKLLRIQTKFKEKGNVSIGTRSIIVNVLNHIENVQSILEQPDPFVGFEQIVGILLKITGKSDLHDALYQVKKIFEEQIGTLIQFMQRKEGRELPNNMDYLIYAEVSAYPSLRRKHHDIMTLLIENPEAVLISEKDYRAFNQRFKVFKQNYVETYATEHKTRNDLVRDFCRDFEGSVHFKLLEALEAVNKELLGKRAEEIRTEISEYRSKECDIKKEELEEILSSETTCTCGYRLKGIEEMKSEIQSQESKALSDILTECATTLDNLRRTLDANRVQFDDLLRESDLTQEGSTLFREINSILENPRKAAEKQFQKVLECTEGLSSMLKKVSKVKVEETKPVKLSDMLRRFKEEVHKTKATIKEILEWIRQRHKEEEEIVIDI